MWGQMFSDSSDHQRVKIFYAIFTSLHLLQAKQCLGLPWDPFRFGSAIVGPWWPLEGPERAWQQTLGYHHQSISLLAKGKAFRSCNLTWQRCHSTETEKIYVYYILYICYPTNIIKASLDVFVTPSWCNWTDLWNLVITYTDELLHGSRFCLLVCWDNVSKEQAETK